MKKILLALASILILTGCTGETTSTNEAGNKTRDFTINETATVNDTKIKINSVKKLLSECSWEYDGECQSETTPDNDYFLIFDLTIENTGTEDLSISSLMSFDIKDENGEKGKYAFLDAITSQLDDSVMPGDLLKGQIAFDVKETDKYTFYYTDSLFDDNIKFTVNKSDITE